MSEINVLPFYRSYWEAAKNLSDTDRLKVYDGIFSFAFEGKEPLFEGISSCFWILSRPNIVKSLKKAAANVENGVKGGRPPKSQQEPNKKPIKIRPVPIRLLSQSVIRIKARTMAIAAYQTRNTINRLSSWVNTLNTPAISLVKGKTTPIRETAKSAPSTPAILGTV